MSCSVFQSLDLSLQLTSEPSLGPMFLQLTRQEIGWLVLEHLLLAVQLKELARFSLKKSTWTRLLPPNKAYLRETQRLPADQELPEFQFVSHPIWQVLAGALQYREKWRLPSRQGKHINVQELHAFIIEEKHAARECKQKRILSGIDSQVTLGSLIKGRSSSPALNSLLRSNLCHPLGSGIFHSYMYFLSEENRADGPTRHKAPAAPDIEYPQWLVDLENGDYAGFDEFSLQTSPRIPVTTLSF